MSTTPNLIHPVAVTIEQIVRATTVYDEDAREPIQAANRGSAVVVPGQPRWGSDKRLEATAGGSVDNAQGYVLFRLTDLTAAGVALQLNDRLVLQNRQLYIVRLQPMGHYDGTPKLIRAWVADREPAKTPAPPARLLRPNEVGGLVGWYRADVVDIDAGLIAAWPDQSGNGNNFFQGSISRRPGYLTGPPRLSFDETQLSAMANVTKMDVLFNSRPLAVLAVCSLNGSSPDGIFGSLLTGALHPITLEDNAATYSTHTLSFDRSTSLGARVLWHDGSSIVYRLDGDEKSRAAAAVVPIFQSPTSLGDAGLKKYSGEIHELLIYSRATPLSRAEIQGLELYLKTTHGTP